MYVCLCNGLTDRDIRRAGDQGHCTVAAAYCSLGAEVNCGRCVPMARNLITRQAALNAQVSADAAE
jgi:bacterioferritin-associated ferredoxin